MLHTRERWYDSHQYHGGAAAAVQSAVRLHSAPLGLFGQQPYETTPCSVLVSMVPLLIECECY